MKVHVLICILASVLLLGFAYKAQAETAIAPVEIKTEVKPSPLTLFPKYVGEENFRAGRIKLRYLTDEEKVKDIMAVNSKGLLVTKEDDSPFDTSGLGGNLAKYVIDLEGTIYSELEDSINFGHSSFVSGKQVMCAGSWQIDKGEIQMIDDLSTQYRTIDHKNLDWCLSHLKSLGLNLEKVSIFYNSERRRR